MARKPSPPSTTDHIDQAILNLVARAPKITAERYDRLAALLARTATPSGTAK